MIGFVNAKINIGLQIVRKREDGYHDLQTLFYPVGKYAGLPENTSPFCDILEISQNGNKSDDPRYLFSGRKVNCEPEDNLVCKAVELFCRETGLSTAGLTVHLDKHLPDGAGMGGGSADSAFTLHLLNGLLPMKNRLDEGRLAVMALKLGADCPFFIYNRPMYGEGVGEKLEDVALDLSGYWLAVVKPDVYVSTKDAFAKVVPQPGKVDLRTLTRGNIGEWQGLVENDFEKSVFHQYPALRAIKESLLESGAVYSSMSGSGSSIYGIFETESVAGDALLKFRGNETIEGSYLLKL